MRARILAILMIAGLLASCASTSVSYWDNPQWVNALGKVVHSGIQYPKDAAQEDFPSGTAIIEFTYDNGKLQAPHILKSTGSKALDAAIIDQIPVITLPKAQGLNTKTPHNFEMEVSLYAANSAFSRAINRAISKNMLHFHFPAAAESRDMKLGAVGWVVINFKYRNGKIFDTKIAQSNGNALLNSIILQVLQTASMPPTPDYARNLTFNLSAPFCIPSRPWQCQDRFMQIQYVPAGTSDTIPKSPCAEVAYRYKDGKISRVHLIVSSGDSNLDKQAVAAVVAGEFPHPMPLWDRAINDYSVPVCNNNRLDARTGSTNQ